MRTWVLAAAAAVLASGCSQDEPAPVENESDSAGALAPGLYQATWTVSGIKSTDTSPPSNGIEQGATGTAQGCVAADGTIDPALFAEGEDACTASSSYVRSGRISMQLECSRPGENGQVMQSVNGSGNAEGIEAEVSTTTYLAAVGDYQMTRTLTAKRVGECPPAGADATLENAAEAATENSAG